MPGSSSENSYSVSALTGATREVGPSSSTRSGLIGKLGIETVREPESMEFGRFAGRADKIERLLVVTVSSKAAASRNNS